jgi:hypothetical protein
MARKSKKSTEKHLEFPSSEVAVICKTVGIEPVTYFLFVNSDGQRRMGVNPDDIHKRRHLTLSEAEFASMRERMEDFICVPILVTGSDVEFDLRKAAKGEYPETFCYINKNALALLWTDTQYTSLFTADPSFEFVSTMKPEEIMQQADMAFKYVRSAGMAGYGFLSPLYPDFLEQDDQNDLEPGM